MNLPILGKENYLKCKSDDYGWFSDENFIIPFFLDKRFIFTRLVFTTEVLNKQGCLNLNLEGLFLDKVIDYIKKHAICDFIYKAQSNVVFNSCPHNSICVPWGTYEINLCVTKEELFNSFVGKSRNVIRKAKKENVIVKKTKNIRIVYENIKETLARQNSIHYPSLNYIKNLSINLKNNICLFISLKDGIVQGSLIIVYDNKKAYAMYAGSIKKPQTGSIDLLHYEAMLYLMDKKVLVYDFVGTRINIQKGSKRAAIDKFKKKFNPTLRSGYTFKTIINPQKHLMYIFFSKVYFFFKGYKYTDPISEIKEESKKKAMLVMGPRYNKNNSDLISGSIVLFEDLLKQLSKLNVSYKIIDTNKKNYTNFFYAYIVIFIKLVKYITNSKYVLLNSSSDYIVYMPILLLYSKVFKKKIYLRKFGGELVDIYSKAYIIKKKYLKFIFSHVDGLFFETKYLVSFFLKINKNTTWFPNVRERTLKPLILPRVYNKKFVFVSHVIKEKGVDEILETAKELDNTFIFDVYGPLLYQQYKEEDFINTKVKYKGVLKAEQVIEKLNDYDVVLLPSYKEGYPGIVIEAYSLGIPVIATSLDGIKEIVDENETGYLVNIKNVDQLVDRIKNLNNKEYRRMSKKAYSKFDIFDSNMVTRKLIDKLFSDL